MGAETTNDFIIQIISTRKYEPIFRNLNFRHNSSFVIKISLRSGMRIKIQKSWDLPGPKQ